MAGLWAEIIWAAGALLILFLILPASAILIVLRIPMVRLIFGAARFDWEATVPEVERPQRP